MDRAVDPERGYFRPTLEFCRVLKSHDLWGREVCQVWFPDSGEVRWVDASELTDDPGAPVPLTPSAILFRATAARLRDAISRTELLAPLEGLVLPLPHQIEALSRAVAAEEIRFLLADEVGLGKTIEAGLILKELKIRGLARRTLVVAPAGLVLQWAQEMRTHFDEDFRVLHPGDFQPIRKALGLGSHDNVWSFHSQVIVSMDAVKPVDGRRGWTKAQLEQYNQERFENLLQADWDLVIIDEAHRLGGSSGQVARHRLGAALAEASPYVLLLSGTPHQGRTDGFRRLMSLLDPDVFASNEAIRTELVAPFVIRTEKRHAVDHEGQPLFRRRDVRLHQVAWSDSHREQRALYEGVTGYVRDGYNQAKAERKTAVGFLMVLMQRLVTSSTQAIRNALERRLQNLDLPEGQLSLFAEDITSDWGDDDSEEVLERALKLRLKGLRDERREVELLLSAARRCEGLGPDVKAHALHDLILRLQYEEEDPETKILVFTEFRATQEMLLRFLNDRGISAAPLHGSMDLEERREAIAAFQSTTRVLVSTEAGGEGLNLQFCHLVVNYDLPWNPMRLEQRIGRVDRIGQEKDVRAFNLSLEDTVEARVQEVLEEKLDVILREFGIDKLGDVLDSEEGELDFDRLFVEVLRRPGDASDIVEDFAADLRRRVADAKRGLEIFGSSEPPDPGTARIVREHQLPRWTEAMTTSFLEHRGGQVTRRGGLVGLTWPDGFHISEGFFHHTQEREGGRVHLTLEHPKVRGILEALGPWVEGSAVTSIEMEGLPGLGPGHWSSWEIELACEPTPLRRSFPLYVDRSGQSFGASARIILDRIIDGPEVGRWRVAGALPWSDSSTAFSATLEAAKKAGEAVYAELAALAAHRRSARRRRNELTFAARRAAIERIGLENVRAARLTALRREEDLAVSRAPSESPTPRFEPVLFLSVAPREGNSQ